MGFALFLAVSAAIALTVILCIKILPAKYDGTFNKKLLQKVHDYFNFKSLYLESILKILFTFLTIACIAVGLFTATIGNGFQFIGNFMDAMEYDFRYMDWIWETLFYNFIGGIAIAVIGPIVLRLAYEAIMMFILLVKNVIDINGKLKAPKAESTEIQE